MLMAMTTSRSTHFTRRKLLAIGIELLPFPGVSLWIAASMYGDWIAIAGIPLTFVTGLGWAAAGRWGTGVYIAIGRGWALALAFGAWVYFALGNIECRDCPTKQYYVTGVIFAITYALTTLGSAVMLAWHAWHAWRAPSWINRAHE